jgi:hypothetical protein
LRETHGPWVSICELRYNRIEIVSYDNIQFTKADHVLRGKGMAPG